MRAAWPKEAYEERANHSPINRFGRVEEVAHAATVSRLAGVVVHLGRIVLVIDGGAVAAGAYMVEKYRRRKAAAKP